MDDLIAIPDRRHASINDLRPRLTRALRILALMVVGCGLAANVRAQATCPPGPTYDDAHGTPGGRVCVPQGNAAFAQSVLLFRPGTYNLTVPCPNTGQLTPPTRAANQNGTASGSIGPPDVPFADFQNPVVRTNNDASLGGRGQLSLRFAVPLTGDGNASTPDVWVWEVGQIAELYTVEVSPDGVSWTLVGQSITTVNGSQGFDIDHAGFNQTSRLFFVRITDVGNQNDGCQAGADIDAVAVLSSITPQISLIKTAAPTSGVHAGDQVIYSFTVTNTGTDTLLNVRVTDPLPGMSPITCLVATLAPNQATTCSATYIVTQANVNAGLIQNTATATGTPQAGGANVTASASATVTPAAPPPLIDLTIAKTHTGPFTQGLTGTYSLTVTNISAAASSGTVSVTDTLPGGLTATAISGPGWTCVLGTLTCTRGDALAPGASFPLITVNVNVGATVPPGILTNVAVVSGGGDSNPANNTARDETPIIGSGSTTIDLTIAKSHLGSFTQNQNGTYSITVTNVGGAASTGTVTVTDTLPAGFTAVAIDGIGWTCTITPLACTRPDALAPGASYPLISLTVKVAATVPVGTSINTSVVSGGGDTNLANNTAMDPTPIMAPPMLIDLALSKTHTGQFVQGQPGTYTLTVTDIGGVASSGVVVVADTLPVGFSVTALSGPGWTCTVASVTCSRNDSVAGGASYPPITLTVLVAATAPPGAAVNSADLSGGGDSNPANNHATDTVTILTPVPVLPPGGLVLMLMALTAVIWMSQRSRRLRH